MKKKTCKTTILAALGACMLAGYPLTAFAEIPDDLFACTTGRDAENDIQVDFKELQLFLPESWAGKCQISTSKTSASFYHLDSRRLWTKQIGSPNGGRLFSICYTEDLNFLELPAYEIIGNTPDGCYYIEYPTDYQGYEADAAVSAEFQEMSSDVAWVTDTIWLKNETEDIYFSADEEYILPQSSTAYLKKNELAGLNADQLQMAINEIYARHHRKFVMPEVQAYFNEKSWYDGYIEPEEFQVNVMNEYESANINLLVECMNALSPHS